MSNVGQREILTNEAVVRFCEDAPCDLYVHGKYRGVIAVPLVTGLLALRNYVQVAH